jgi:ABC-type nickel/cobalt efflux system permease component RcnA
VVLKSTELRTQRFRGSPLAIRIGSGLLAAILLGNLLFISISRLRSASAARDYVLLGALWSLAIVALWLLVRAWRTTVHKTGR